MTRHPLASCRYQHLVADAHTAGITRLIVAAVVSHHDQILLIDGPADLDFPRTWDLPGDTVLSGQTLTGTLDEMMTGTGLGLQEITAYLGHHDHLDSRQEQIRTFGFTATASDPTAICRRAELAHQWLACDDLPADLTGTARAFLESAPPADSTSPRAITRQHPLAQPLRACARGIYPDEAAIELLIGHDTFLHRDDFTSHITTGEYGQPGNRATHAAIDWTTATTALDAGALPCSGGEQRILRLAASLAAGVPVNLRDTLTGLDDRNLALAISSFMHASGQRPPHLEHDHFLVHVRNSGT